VVLFGCAVAFRILNSVVDGIEHLILPTGVHQIDHSNPIDDTMDGTAVLAVDDVHLGHIPFILDTVIEDQVGSRAVVDLGVHNIPEAAGRQLLATQEIADRVMAHGLFAIQVIGEVCAGQLPVVAIKYSMYWRLANMTCALIL